MNAYTIWFGRAMWLGILADWVLCVPAIFAPNWTLELFGQQPAIQDAQWVAFAALLVVLLSFFYIPAALDPYLYPAAAWLGVLARPPGVIFFLWLYPGQYTAFGIVDLILLLIQGPLLLLVLRAEPRPDLALRSHPIEKQAQAAFEYDGSTFAEVKAIAFSGPYDALPFNRGLSLTTFLQFFNASARNLADRRDIRPRFDKLIHANGICYTGVWRIDQDSSYTGYFAKGSQGLIIARLSVAGNRLTRGYRRAFGIAGKIFPTLDPNQKLKPANFVTVNHLSGIRNRHITDAMPTNQPTIGLDPAANIVNRIVFRMVDTRPGYRLLTPISTLAVPHNQPVVTPDLLMLKVAPGTPKVEADDFRDELRLANYPNNKLVYTINVKSFEAAEWTRLGSIEFTDDAISEGGDKRLHFWIPLDVPSHN